MKTLAKDDLAPFAGTGGGFGMPGARGALHGLF